MEALGGMLLCCVLLSLTVLSASERNPISKINSICGLVNTDFGHTFPRHGLKLLYCIVKRLNIDNNNVIRPRFYPTRGDYGFHEFYNFERVFPPIPSQNVHAYFAVGNINSRQSWELPSYVVEDFDNSFRGERDRNMDRIVVRLNRNSNVIDELYITQHYPLNDYRRNEYDPDNTYQLSTVILRAIQIENLPVFLNAAGYRYNANVCHRPNKVREKIFKIAAHNVGKNQTIEQTDYHGNNNTTPLSLVGLLADQNCDLIKLQVKTTDFGCVRMKWDDIPTWIMLLMNVNVALYSNGTEVASTTMDKRGYGTADTKVSMNPDLQVRLVYDKRTVIIGGSVTGDADRKIPVDIDGYDAGLQLYTKNGWAGARLYIKKTFENWRDVFHLSWVGFYKSATQGDTNYNTWQWAVSFTKGDETNNGYDVYYYCSNMYTQPLAQARFFLKREKVSLKSTLPWET